jgi:hypothetical protein
MALKGSVNSLPRPAKEKEKPAGVNRRVHKASPRPVGRYRLSRLA